MFSLFNTMLAISETISVTLRNLFECRQNSPKQKFELIYRGKHFLRRMRF